MRVKKVLSETVKYGMLILAFFFITGSILHEYNPGMMYLTNTLSLTLLRIFCILGIVGFFVRETREKKE